MARRWLRRFWGSFAIVLMGLFVIGALAAGGGDHEGATERAASGVGLGDDLAGKVDIDFGYQEGRLMLNGATRAACQGQGGYADLAAGSTVVVTNGEGKVIATGAIGPGAASLTQQDVDSFKYSRLAKRARHCVMPFLVAGVPRADFYRVQIGHRPPLTYSRSELDAMEWTIDLSLG